MPTREVTKLGDTEQVATTTFHIRGREYAVTEIPAENYEEALRSASILDEEGKATDRTDMLMFEKLLAIESVKIDGEPVELETWNKLPYPVTNRILTEVKRMHWIDIETDEEKAAREKAAKERSKGKRADAAESDIPNS